MDQCPKILVVSTDCSRGNTLVSELQHCGFETRCHSCLTTLLGSVFSDSPDMIMVDLVASSAALEDIVKSLKSECYFSAVPVLGFVDKGNVIPCYLSEVPLDDFLVYPVDRAELHARVCLALNRIHRVFDNNPLTRLPGNTSVQNAITDAIGKPMAVCYLDINHFKPFNDVYGFAHGDEVLRMLS